ncbi:MAG: cryptochrome/photolyase family protein [Schleiferiaceae bacterium]
MKTTVRLILGDQLNPHHSWFEEVNDSITYVLIESWDEATYAPHHIQKVAGIFSAMRQFADSLEQKGHHVHYINILTSRNKSIAAELDYLCVQAGIQHVEIQEPDEWRLRQILKSIARDGLTLRFVSSEHFISAPGEFRRTFEGKKTYVMETFYRKLRKRTGILMDGATPFCGKWNYDAQNRKKLPKNHLPPPPFLPETDVSQVVADIKEAGIPCIGALKDPKHFYWPTTPDQAWEVYEQWLAQAFPLFGDYQDAMTVKDWALYHSRISFALNTKMMDPLAVCRRAEEVFRSREDVPINAAEGFIRQILGWREFMRNIYEVRMPEFGEENYFGHDRKLPEWFWTGDTKMKCQSHAIGQSLQHGYAHHIQRLMVTGNFLLLAGIDPDEVDFWYLGIYIDAFEWVEITNTRGMSQFADGGWIATKPYVASANYMKKMGDYCDNCVYNPKTKTDKDSCPLNALYWDFFERNRDKLGNNFRLGMVYRTYDKMSSEQKQAISAKAADLLEQINEL